MGDLRSVGTTEDEVWMKNEGVFLHMTAEEWSLSYSFSFIGRENEAGVGVLGHVNLSVWSFSHMIEIKPPGDRTVLCFCPSPSSSLTHVCLANDEEEEEEEERKERVQEERHMPFSSPLNIRHVRRYGGVTVGGGRLDEGPNHRLLVAVCVCFSPKSQETLQIKTTKNICFSHACRMPVGVSMFVCLFQI